MSVLIISPFFYPEPISTGRYNTALAQELVRRGEAVEVIASHPIYPDWRPQRSNEQLPGMCIRRGGAWLRYPGQPVLRRLLLEVWFAAHASLEVLRLRLHSRRIVVVLPPCLLMLTLRLLLPRSSRTIGVVHDLQGVLAARASIVGSGLLLKIVRWIERRAFKTCDRLIFLSASMTERAVAEYSLDRSICAVHYPFLTLPEHRYDGGVMLEPQLPLGWIHIVYSGALGDKQEPDKLLSFMRELVRKHTGLRCHIFSRGPHFDRLRTLASETDPGVVAFHPLVAEAALEELYARSSVQILPQARGTGWASIPSKLPNLLAAGVPVFAICDHNSEIVQLLNRAGDDAGSHASGFEAQDLHARFEGLLRRVQGEKRETRVARRRAFVQRYFSPEGVVDEILKL